MKEVADFLIDSCQSNPSSHNPDMYIKSALNRYYYDVYGHVVKAIIDITGKNTDKFSHGGTLGGLLSGASRREILNGIDALKDNKEKKELLKFSYKDINKALDSLYEARQAADYDRECLIKKETETDFFIAYRNAKDLPQEIAIKSLIEHVEKLYSALDNISYLRREALGLID